MTLVPRRIPTSRRGFTLLELTVAMVVLGAAAALVLQLALWTKVSLRQTQTRQWARREVSQHLESLASLPWNEITPKTAATIEPSAAMRRLAPDAELTAEVLSEDKPFSRKRIVVRLRWRDRAGNWNHPLRLVAWAYPEEARPIAETQPVEETQARGEGQP
ncbi:MAG: prepilin-type N-terminal cleavage/methylation domain-containing protein [Planctomycetales bacterium]